MWIVLDTNIFFEDFRLKKSLDLLFRSIENVDFSLKIPEVVVQEVVNKYRYKTSMDKIIAGIKTKDYTSIQNHFTPQIGFPILQKPRFRCGTCWSKKNMPP